MRLVLAGLDLVREGDQAFDEPTIRRLVDRIGYGSLPLLIDVVGVLGVEDRALGMQFRELDQSEDLSDLSPELDGESVMEILGIEAGPEVGAALGVLRQRRFEEGPLSREDEVAHLLERYKRNR